MSGTAGGGAVFINSEALGRFSFSPDHPFKPERVRRVFEMCSSKGLFSGPGVSIVNVEEPLDGILETFHTADYIEALRRADSGGEIDLDMLHHGIGSMENPVFKGVHSFSVLSATATVTAARIVAEKGGCSFNPCGGFHHAHPDRASGFCYVNDVVIAIKELKERGVRTAYLDIDAHHGDGVQEAFYDDPGVLTISVHESGKTLFPWGGFERETGAGSGVGYNINLPLEPDTDDDVFLYLFNKIVIDALELFRPEIIVGQFGTDTLATDPLTHLRMTNNGYIEAIDILKSKFPSIVALGGGGYNLADSVRAWTLLWASLAELELAGGYGGALGGVFLGDASLDGADLRDMRIYTTGPTGEKLREEAGRQVSWYEEEIRPILSGEKSGDG